MKSYQDKPPFQGARGNHGDCNSKGCNSKASMVTYRTRQFPIGLGLASINLRVIHMNLWLKPREKRAAKRELNSSSKRLGLRSRNKTSMVSGACGGESHFSLGQTMPGVKQDSKALVLRSLYRTLETFFSTFFSSIYNENEGESGSKPMPRVVPGIDLLVNPRGRRLPMTLNDKGMLVIYP